MKSVSNALLLMVVFAGLTGACNKAEEIDLQNYLYRRWQLIESRSATGSVYRPDPARPTVITFYPSGEYVYEFNGKPFTCCQPNRFVRQGNQLRFSVAPRTVASECANVLCAPYQPELVIDSLSAERLVLSVKDSTGQTVYQAVR